MGHPDLWRSLFGANGWHLRLIRYTGSDEKIRIGFGMKRRVERVRVGLIAGSVLLLVVLAGMYGYARYRAGKAWLNRLKDRSGASLVRETDGFTYSQSLKGKTVFTLHAAKAFQHSDGHWVLHDVVVTLYGQHDDRVDRVYGNEFEWDENQGVAHAVGEVQMDLQVPAGIAASNPHSGPAAVKSDSPASVHVRTSGLVFVRQFGVAATHELVEFRYGGLTCLSKGAEFENSPSALHLLGDVRVNGVMRGEPVALSRPTTLLPKGALEAYNAMICFLE